MPGNTISLFLCLMPACPSCAVQLPFVIVSAVVFLIVIVAVIRAALATRSQHAGALCFMQARPNAVGTNYVFQEMCFNRGAIKLERLS